MSHLRVRVRAPDAAQPSTFELPAEAPVGSLLRVMLDRLGIEPGDRVPHLYLERTGEAIGPGDSLEQAGVSSEDVLELRLEAASAATESSPEQEPARPGPPVTAAPATPEPAARPPDRGRRVWPLAAGAALIVLGGLVLRYAALPPASGAPCESFDACQRAAEERIARGDLAGAVELFSLALERVDERPPHAFLWCDRGDLLADMGRLDEARASFEQCARWTEGDPGLHEIRLRAEARMRDLDPPPPR